MAGKKKAVKKIVAPKPDEEMVEITVREFLNGEPRKFIQVISHQGWLLALANDGSIWEENIERHKEPGEPAIYSWVKRGVPVPQD